MATTGSVLMRGTDAFAWHMERDPALRSTVVALIWLDRAPDWEALTARIDYMSRRMQSLRQRVVESPLPFAPPRWTYDEHFDFDWHLRRVSAPPPYSTEAVLDFARRAAMDAFDRDRPLWEFTLVEGLKGAGPQAAFVMKVHHSLSDGVGGMRLMTVLFDLQRRPGRITDMPPAPVPETSGLRGANPVGAVVGYTARLARHGTGAAASALAHGLRHPLAAVHDAAAMTRSVYRTVAPISDTRSPVMRQRAMTRHLATIEVPLDDLKRAATAVDGTVNDAYLAALTGGLRLYHERHEARVDSLRVTLPISIRAEDDTEWGNRITLQRVVLPVAETDPAARMRLVHDVIGAARAEPSLPVTDTIAGAINMLPAGYVGGMLKHVDFLASNVAGSPRPIYLAGAKVTGFFAFGPTIGASLNATLISYGDTCDIGVNIDTAAVPDPDVLLECLQDSFVEIGDVGEPVE